MKLWYNMKYAVVYGSPAGNNRILAEALKNRFLPDRIFCYGMPDEKALAADIIFTGFWTDSLDIG